MSELTAARKADREAMAAQVAALAADYGIKAEHKPEQPGTRRTDVDLTGRHDLRLTVKFDAGSPSPDVYVLSWHGVTEGIRLSPRAFGSVNSPHGRKATDVVHGFSQLMRVLRLRFTAIENGEAFSIVYRQA